MAAGGRGAARDRPGAVVTGGHGFIGSWVVKRLLAEGYRVLIIDRASGRVALEAASTSARPAGASLDAVAADIVSPRAAKAVAAFAPRLVVHAAAQTKVSQSVADPAEDARVNVEGTLAMLEAARVAAVEGFVFLSSAAIYGEPRRLPIGENHATRPLSPYGLSKLAATSYVDHYRAAGLLPTVSLIPANAYGPGQEAGSDGAVVASLVRAATRGEPLTLAGDGRQTRDFVFVEDLVEAVWLAWLWLQAGASTRREVAAAAEPGVEVAPGATPAVRAVPGRFNVGTGAETRIADLAGAVEHAAGSSLGRVWTPSRAGDIRRSCLEPSLARAVLGWSASVALTQGLGRTLDWWQERRGSASRGGC